MVGNWDIQEYGQCHFGRIPSLVSKHHGSGVKFVMEWKRGQDKAREEDVARPSPIALNTFP